MLVWLDLETTGKHPSTSCILELGMIVTDDELVNLGQASWVFRFELRESHQIDPVVIQMHTDNGLWAECAASDITIYEAEKEAVEFLENLGVPRGEVPLAGRNIGFDRRFLADEAPTLLDYFHYRNVDMSSEDEIARRWVPLVYQDRPRGGTHRALDDLRYSIELARYYKENIYQPY